MTTDQVDAGAILIAQIVAADVETVDSVWICPVEAGWTYIAGVLGNPQIVQHLWWRPVTELQPTAVPYTFVSREGDSCESENDVETAMTGAIAVFSGVDTSNPIGEAVSKRSNSSSFDVKAPATTASHPAGSRIVRYIGGDYNTDPIVSTEELRYAVLANSDGGPRVAASYDAALVADGIAAEKVVEFRNKIRWVATTVVLYEPSDDEPIDAIAPETSASSGEYDAGEWTNAASVNVALAAVDTGSSGVKEIVYSATGAQSVENTTVAGDTANLTITSEGETTVSYYARDHAENAEEPQTFIVRIDRSAPSLSGEATTPPNANGWYRSDVAIAWVCSDTLSGIAGLCPANSSITGEGDDLSANGSVVDVAGNQRSASVTGIKIDRTPPSTNISSIPDWSSDPLTVTLTPTDNLSGVEATFYTVNDGPEQSGNQVLFDQSGQYTLKYWSVDTAGNREDTQQVEIHVDRIAPTITHSLSIQPNAVGWHNTPVTVTFTCADGNSSIASCTEQQELTSDGEGQIVVGTAVDAAGNSATETVTINIDKTPPTITAERTPAANTTGWDNQRVTVSFTCSDLTSGVVTCPEPQEIGEGENQQATATVFDHAGNSSTVTISNLNVDLTAPSISAIAKTADGQTYVPGTWTNQTVTVRFSCSDALSGIAVCPSAETFDEGAGQRIEVTAFDVAGNSASLTVEGINVDLTVPTISATLTTDGDQPYTPGDWSQQPVTVTFQCADGLSPVATCSAPATFTDGKDQGLVGSVTDLAGNTASISVAQINVDTTAPTILAVATTADQQPYVSDTWTNQAVAIVFTCDDVVSGLAGPCPDPIMVDESTGLSGQVVTAQVSDLAGNSAVSNDIVVKVDLDAPSFTFTPEDLVVEAVDAGDTIVTWETPLAVDDVVGAVDVTCLPGSGTAFAVGTQTITCTATDLASNVATTSFTVTVNEPPAPVLTVPEDIVVPADGPWGAIVHYGPVTSESSLAADPTCTPKSGSLFEIGTTTVNCSAGNARGTQATASFTITVLGGADLLANLHVATAERTSNPTIARTLLKTLYLVDAALTSGDSERALIGMQQYRMQIHLSARTGRLASADALQLLADAELVIGAFHHESTPLAN